MTAPAVTAAAMTEAETLAAKLRAGYGTVRRDLSLTLAALACAHDPPCPDFPAHQKAQRKEWKAALALHRRNLRNGRARRKPPQYRPGMNTSGGAMPDS